MGLVPRGYDGGRRPVAVGVDSSECQITQLFHGRSLRLQYGRKLRLSPPPSARKTWKLKLADDSSNRVVVLSREPLSTLERERLPFQNSWLQPKFHVGFEVTTNLLVILSQRL